MEIKMEMEKKHIPAFIGYGLGILAILSNLVEIAITGSLLYFRPGLVLIGLLLCLLSLTGLLHWAVTKRR